MELLKKWYALSNIQIKMYDTKATHNGFYTKEYIGNFVILLQAGTDFVRNNFKKAWCKVGDDRIERIDYPARAGLEGGEMQ